LQDKQFKIDVMKKRLSLLAVLVFVLVSGFSINPQVRNGSVPDEPPIIIPPFKVSVVETVQQCIAVNAFSLNAE
jgi:hypothetical protein